MAPLPLVKLSSAMISLPNLNTEIIWAILNDSVNDAVVNALVWKCLGYRCDDAGNWDITAVAPEWCEQYPEPPNFIESRPATIQLTRSIPPAYKQLLKEKLGFKGYKVNELNPRLTRRATAANWLLGYMMNWGDDPFKQG